MQTLEVKGSEELTLALLRKKHAEAGFKGMCVVRFAPNLYAKVVDLPGFLPIGRYNEHVVPADPEEVGGVEVFHLVPASPIDYSDAGFA